MSVAAPTLTGTHVQLEQLRFEFAEELAAAGKRRPIDVRVDACATDASRACSATSPACSPTSRRAPSCRSCSGVRDGALVGCTRYLRLEWWGGNALPDEVEIGGTWLAASAQRTPINTEAKYLLLSNAFESWNVHRVSICTDARNTQSRTAILRIGATFEGILRSHRGSYARRRGEHRRPRLGDVLGDSRPTGRPSSRPGEQAAVTPSGR